MTQCFDKKSLFFIVRINAMNYNKMIFSANINKIQTVRKFVAKIAVAKEFKNSLLLHSPLSINQNEIARADMKW